MNNIPIAAKSSSHDTEIDFGRLYMINEGS
jgi:hypothetical protein